jgi:hypothetical protein
MPIDSEHFLENFAKALNSFDPKLVASFHLPPTIIMNDKNKKVLASEAELDQTFSLMFAKFKEAGIERFEPKLQQTLRLSDSLFFSKMRWKLYDGNDQLCFGCATSYTLQKMPDNILKIIVSVIDDDEHRLADILSLTE